MTYKNSFRLIYTVLLTALLAGGSMKAMAQDSDSSTNPGVVIHGNVYGGGNQADVQVNTAVNMSIGQVYGNVYGGGKLGDVGNITKNTTDYNYSWKQNDGTTANTANNNNISGTNNNTGVSTVTITGGTIGQGTLDENHGNVFGGGKGEANTFWCEKGIVYATNVSISAGTVNGSVYGGGEVGRVEDDTKVKIGPDSGNNGPSIKGNVFGAGAGVETHGYSALVRGNSIVTVQGGASVDESVYGGGKVATVGKFWVTGVNYPTALNAPTAPTDLPDGMPYAWRDGGECRVTVQGSAEITGDVFGAGMGKVPDEFPTHFVSMTDPDDPEKIIKVEYYSIKTASEVGDIDTRMPKRMVNYEAYNETTKKGFKDDDKNITWVPYDDDDNPTIVWEYFDTPEKYHTFLQTLAIVDKPITIIGGAAEVNGSVFGGSESGFVLDETSVTIQGDCTIGTTTTGGNVFGGGKGLASFSEAGRVRKNTNLTINNGTIYGNVYGGGSLGDVGNITKPADYNYKWKQSDGSTANVAEYNKNATDTNTGICKVTVSGGTIGTYNVATTGHVFGAGKGLEDTWWCEKAIAYATNVIIKNSGTTVYGNVYGGGQVGRVEDDAKVVIGTASGSDAPEIKGSVFGAGAGIKTHGYSALVRGNSDVTIQGGAQVGGSVYGGGEIASVGRFTVVGGLPKHPDSGGTCKVTIQGNAKIGSAGTGHNVFGACKGVTPVFDSSDFTKNKSMQIEANRPKNADGTVKAVNDYWNYVETYDEGYQGTKFVWVYYRTEVEYLAFLKTLALTSHPHVTIAGSASVYGSVYGGGERGVTLGHVDVDITGGTVAQDIYGGGALADTNLANWDENEYEEIIGLTVGKSPVKGLYTRSESEPYIYTIVSGENPTAVSGTKYYRKGKWSHDSKSAWYTTHVSLTGGTITGDAYGGGLGQKEYGTKGQVGYEPAIEAQVYGNVLVELNGKTTTTNATTSTTQVDANAKGCIVNRVFGCNNLNGTPKGKVQVHVYATQKTGESTISNKATVGTNIYDVQAVYGGGNLAKYEPVDATLIYNETNKAAVDAARPEVLIEGCDVTSIKQVYGGGNAAPAPATYVEVRSAYEIDEVFGGGNGFDNYSLQEGNATKWYQNPGANVGYYTYADYPKTGDNAGAGTEGNPWKAVEISKFSGGSDNKGNRLSEDDPDAIALRYGSGIATLVVKGGTIHTSYGGSNSKGNVRTQLSSTYTAMAGCDMAVGSSYGGGKNAYSDADADVSAECAKGVKEMFGGSRDADFDGDINLRITNGSSFERVFGGNNTSGAVNGSITVTIEEGGCEPIRIKELYLGGFLAPYSVYGYMKNGDGSYKTESVSYIDENGETKTKNQRIPLESGNRLYNDPRINVISATRIDNIYGGGYQAKLVGNPHINVNMEKGKISEDYRSTYSGTPAIDGAGNLPIGTIGNIYGGGNMADIVGSTYVEIGTGKWVTLDAQGAEVEETLTRNAATITGNVYGGGNAADVSVNTNVTMANGSVENRIYGGGNLGSVGTFTLNANGKPDTWTENTGICNVTITGGVVGPVETTVKMDPNDPSFDHGHVFGASRGPDPENRDDNAAYVNYTNVTIKGTAFVKGGVYGGSENGHVRHDTRVNIEGGQIGCGKGTAERYPESVFISEPSDDKDLECDSWPYVSPYRPYDPNALETGKYADGSESYAMPTGSDGHTFYGNVFGGGSGYYPYKDEDGKSHWVEKAGLVEGDTYVTITGGHILTNVYGGNELSNVDGVCHISMSGGTIGVPRTLTQISVHPVTCYLFGAGKGDQRVFFNKSTNVKDVVIEITGGTIFGSVFGGGEDGHVLRDVTMTIDQASNKTTKIGTWGTSYVDGNVFGGGRGFGGDAYTAGNVAGSVKMDIKGGEILGSVYGGGRLGSVGYGLFDAKTNGQPTPGYGEMRDDTDYEEGFIEEGLSASEYFTKGRGHIEITISGGTIGNNIEFDYEPTDNTYMSKTLFDSSNRLMHTKGGNVFAGGMGRREKLDGTTVISIEDDGIDWHKLGNVKSTKLTISGTAWIKGNVYGGGEFGAVTGNHAVLEGTTPVVDAQNKAINASTEIIINGGTIGTMMQKDVDPETVTSATTGSGDFRYTFGSVFGGGYGTEADVLTTPYTTDINKFAALVNGNTYIKMTNGKVRASVYGGGEMACVSGNTYANISGGDIGINEVRTETEGKIGYVLFGSWKMGNVYGAGKGSTNAVYSGLVTGNTNVNISGSPGIYHNVYGGGAIGSVGTFSLYSADENSEFTPVGAPKAWTDGTGTATITIIGTPTIGINGWDNGMVNGSGRGDVSNPVDAADDIDPYDRLAWTKDTKVTIGTSESETGPAIKGSLYGGGENGHNSGDSEVKLYSGTIGVATTDDTWGSLNIETRGNVFGSGCGTDKYDSDGDNIGDKHNRTSGFVQGNSTVYIYGGHVFNSVYGGGSMASIGIDGKKATVNVSGGVIDGSVYGGPKGDIMDTELKARAKASEVNIESGADVKGSVFGGGEAGVIEGSVVVNMTGGTVEHDVYGGGALADTNTSNTSNTTANTTAVSLTGGIIKGNAYGGGLGRKAQAEVQAQGPQGEEGSEGYIPPVAYQAAVEGIAALVKGDVKVELNKDVDDTSRGCVVKQVFGCNNLNGTPEGNVEVHVYKTQRAGATQIVNSGNVTDAKVEGTQRANGDFDLSTFDVSAVYGGGNQADYIPVAGTDQRTYVVIEGCDRTSIGNVYGGGNAAAVPGTLVLIKGSYEIGEVFGGGNGVVEGTRANVGFDNNVPHNDYVIDSDGKAVVQLMAGKVKYVYGGSNTRGDIRGGSTIENVTNEWISGNTACCEELQVGPIFAGGKNADMEGGANVILGCTNSNDWVEEIYAGARNANVGGDVSLTITSGKYGRVFGGNMTSGKLDGSITVNIEENGACGIPVIIGELYGGGNMAAYSIYGYNDDGTVKEAPVEGKTPHASPVINVRGFTSIGNIFGGGYGASAKMVGSPTINISELAINHEDKTTVYQGNKFNETPLYFVNNLLDPTITTDPADMSNVYKVIVPAHDDGKLGTIGYVYGGGNAAEVKGDTHVNIGTETEVYVVIPDVTGNVKGYYTRSGKGTTSNPYVYTLIETDTNAAAGVNYYLKKDVTGADIRGNVYGGGNNAEVTGNTNVTIGKEATTTTP